MNYKILKARNFKCNFYVLGFLVLLFFCACAKNNTKSQEAAAASESDLSEMEVHNTVPIAKEIVSNQKSRVRDAYGSGQYGSSRDGGVRTHKGIDIIVKPGEKIFSPIKGNIIRQAMPYGDDPSYKGIVLRGVEQWEGYELKIFYVEGLFSGTATEMQEIGNAQDLTIKYPRITNHIHVEVKHKGVQIDPFTLWQYSF
ncbi:hypothetical protein [Flavobacterium beibuense]|uniref:hypothetical protein n=1 Tax=Flavobacterium beibuense TaxID=657326 RepID=UPI003A8D8FA9